MKRIPVVVMILFPLTTVPMAAVAQEMQPGRWEISLTMTTPSAPDQNFGPFTQSYCISSADVLDPTRLLGMVGATPNTCSYGKHQVSGNELRFDISCPGIASLALEGSGQANWTPDTMSATFTIRSRTQEGMAPISAQIGLSAHRTGGC